MGDTCQVLARRDNASSTTARRFELAASAVLTPSAVLTQTQGLQHWDEEEEDHVWATGPIARGLLRKLPERPSGYDPRMVMSHRSGWKPGRKLEICPSQCEALMESVPTRKGCTACNECRGYDPVLWLPPTSITKVEVDTVFRDQAQEFRQKAWLPDLAFLEGLLRREDYEEKFDGTGPTPGDYRGGTLFSYSIRVGAMRMTKMDADAKAKLPFRLARATLELNKVLLPKLLKWVDGYMYTKARMETDRRSKGERPRYLCRCGHGDAWHSLKAGNAEDSQEAYYHPAVELRKTDFSGLRPGSNSGSRPGSEASSTSSLAHRGAATIARSLSHTWHKPIPHGETILGRTSSDIALCAGRLPGRRRPQAGEHVVEEA